MSNIIEFPSGAERELRRTVARAAEALRLFLKDGPQMATLCRRVTDKCGADREVYERVREVLNLWAIRSDNLYLALPQHGRNFFEGRPVKGRKPKPKANNR
jgi:hypothetical protein